MEPCWASKKSVWSRAWAAKTLPRWVPTWASKNHFFEAQVDLHFGGGLGGPWAPQSIFLEAQEIPQNPLKIEVS